MARLVVSVAAGVVAYFASGYNPYVAFQVGAAVYGLSAGLDPNKKVLGPKLDDLKAPKASYGAPIPYLEGAPRLAGVYIWASDKREIANTTTEGKGGPGVDSTTFTYEMDVLIELAINECAGIRRVWSNGKLVWSNADDADAETLAASGTTNSWRDIRFYGGGPTQLPDPTYEAAVGIGNAPAYRTRTTVMIEGLNLGNSGQLPVLTFETLSEADTGAGVATLASVPAIAPFSIGTPAMSLLGFQIHVGQWDNNYSNGVVFIYDVAPDGTVTASPSGGYEVALPGPCATGNTDESCLMVFDQYGSGNGAIYFAEPFLGTSVPIQPGENMGTNAVRFSKLGDDIVICSRNLGAKKVHRFSRTGAGVPLASSVPMVGYMQSIAIGAGKVYALRTLGAEVYQLDLTTLTLEATFATPSSASASSLVCKEGGQLVLASDGDATTYEWSGSSWITLATGVGGGIRNNTDSSFTWADGTLLSSEYDTATSSSVIRYIIASIAIVDVMLDQVVRRLCLRTGLLTDDDIDVTDLSSDVAIADGFVRSMAVSQVSTTRATLETLMSAYLFESVEGEKLRFVKRGGATVMTIPYEDMGASADGTAEPLPKKRLNDIEIAARVSVKYANVLNDSQDGLEQADRLVTESEAEAVVEIPLGFNPIEAKKLADANTMDLAVSILQIGPISLPRKYAALEPTDLILLTDASGSTFRTRIVKGTIGGGLNTFELVLDDASVINSVAATDDDYASSTLLRLLSNSELEMLDIPILRDVDNALGPYAAVTGGMKWSGAEIDRSIDDTVYSRVATVSDKATLGIATTTLGNFTGGNVFDELNSVTVNVGEGVLSSASKTDALAGTAPAYLIGSEIIYACTAALQSPGVYKLTTLLRGERGTEWAIATHIASERVVLLQPSGMRKLTDSAADLNVARYYKAVTIGKSASDVEGDAFTDTGVALKPFAPVDLRLETAGVQDMVLSWHRRSRLASGFLAVPPLGEANESYEADIFNGATFLRTLATSTASATYTTAQQSADGVSSATSLTFKVYQISQMVGRGYPGLLGASAFRSPLPQITVITVGGSFASGAPLFAIFGSKRFDYTSVAGDTNLSGIAISLAAVIDADTSYAATGAATNVTVTGPVSQIDPVVVGQNAGDNTISFATTQTASPVVAGAREQFNFGWNWAGKTIGTPTTFTVLARRYSDFSYRRYEGTNSSPNPSNEPNVRNSVYGNFVASGDRAAFDLDMTDENGTGSGTLYSPLADPENWTIEVYCNDSNVESRAARRGTGVTPVPVARPQVSTATLAGTPATGRTYRITLAGVSFDYTALVTDTTMALIASGLTAVIDAAAAYAATSTGAVITITGAVANVPFIYSGQVIVSTVTLSASITQQAA